MVSTKISTASRCRAAESRPKRWSFGASSFASVAIIERRMGDRMRNLDHAGAHLPVGFLARHRPLLVLVMGKREFGVAAFDLDDFGSQEEAYPSALVLVPVCVRVAQECGYEAWSPTTHPSLERKTVTCHGAAAPHLRWQTWANSGFVSGLSFLLKGGLLLGSPNCRVANQQRPSPRPSAARTMAPSSLPTLISMADRFVSRRASLSKPVKHF